MPALSLQKMFFNVSRGPSDGEMIGFGGMWLADGGAKRSAEQILPHSVETPTSDA
jgi:hypothetical protein